MLNQESRCAICGFQEYTECFSNIITGNMDCPSCNADETFIRPLKRLTGKKKYKLEKLAESTFKYHNTSLLVEDLIQEYKLTFEQGLYFTDCILNIVRREAILDFKRKQHVLKSIKNLKSI